MVAYQNEPVVKLLPTVLPTETPTNALKHSFDHIYTLFKQGVTQKCPADISYFD